jgi:hypothetical protein
VSSVPNRLAPLAAVLVGLVSLAPMARASDTQWWNADRAADFAKTEARGVVVRPDGSLETGPAVRETRIDSLGVVWSVAVLRDGSVALGGDHGRIDRWSARGGLRRWARVAGGQVFSLAADGDGVVAGTGPGGLVWRVAANGDTSRVAATGERYVWALAPDGKGGWWAASGNRGRLLRIADGKVRVVLDTDESNLVCLLPDGRGGVYAGGDSHGRVVHADAAGASRTVYDAAEDEVRALALGPDGALWAAALSASAVSEEDDAPEGPRPVGAAVSGGRAVVYRIVPDSSAYPVWTSPQPFIFALASTPDGVVAATGGKAALYRLEPSGGASQLMLLPQGQVTALAGLADGGIVAATSNPAAILRVGPARAERGELLSTVQDARRIARFGALRWSGSAGDGRVELYARSGNSDPPDTTWSAWGGGAAPQGSVRAGIPAARYLQWKAVLTGTAKVLAVDVAWREQNVPPRIEDLVVAPQGGAFREGELTPHAESVTQTLTGGQKVEYSMPSASGPRALRALPAWARGLRTVQWKGVDANGDLLRYRVDARREPDGAWVKLGDELEESAFTWDTNALPDGIYRLRVRADDAVGNAVGEERTGETLSEPFTLDNTPPVVSALEAQGVAGGIRVTGGAEDATSPLSRLEVAVDDGDWRALTPKDGLTDARSASFDATLRGVEPGEHSLSVRAMDLAGNTATRSARVVVARTR